MQISKQAKKDLRKVIGDIKRSGGDLRDVIDIEIKVEDAGQFLKAREYIREAVDSLMSIVNK